MSYEVLTHEDSTTVRTIWFGPNGEQWAPYTFRPPVPFPEDKSSVASLGEMVAIAVLGHGAEDTIELTAIIYDAEISDGEPYPGEVTVRVNKMLEGTRYTVSL